MNAVFSYKCSQCGNSTKKEVARCAVCKSFKIEKTPMSAKVETTASHVLGRHSQCDLFKMPNSLIPGIAVSVAVIKNELLPIEIQMSVNGSKLVQPLIKRNITTIGLAKDRIYFILSMLPAHLRHINDISSSIAEENKIMINAIGGVDVKKDVALDLSVACGIVSSMKQITIFKNLVILGEIGINGEIKPVSYLKERLDFASKLGFKKAIVPNSNTKNYSTPNMDIKAVEHLEETLNYLFEGSRYEKP